MNFEMKLPQMSLTMQEGTITRWLKAEGEHLNKNEPLLELETDKVATELTAPREGILSRILVATDDTVPVETVLCIIADEAEGSETSKSTAGNFEPEAVPVGIPMEKMTQARRGYRASPLAMKIAADKGISLEGIQGTGPHGVIVKRDVLNMEAATAMKETSDTQKDTAHYAQEISNVQEIPLTGARKKTAEQMMRSRQMTASLTTFAEVDMTEVRKMRQYVHVSYTAYAVKAAAKALTEFPYMNSSLKQDKILLYGDVNINVAVSTGDKLVTPVLPHADKKDIFEIGDEIGALAQRGHEGALGLADFEGGTFTVTNSGVFGSLFFTPIINYPQCAILGVGKLIEQPVVRDGEIVIAPMMNLCLTYDHQIVDGATAVGFLQKVKYYLEHPAEMAR